MINRYTLSFILDEFITDIDEVIQRATNEQVT